MMRSFSFLLSLLLTMAGVAHAYPEGKSAFMFHDEKNRLIEVLIYQPKNFTAQSPIQFVMHGVSRNAEQTREKWIGLAERTGILVVAPKFSKNQFKHGTDYTMGENDPNMGSNATLMVVEHLFDRIKKDTGNQRTTYRIYGHSAGAQYVHRLMLLYPQNRSEWAVAANAGWYTMPEWRAESSLPPAPYSMKGISNAEARVKQALGRKMILLLGDKDIDVNHMQLQHGVEVDQQGLERFSRGKRFFSVAEQSAKTLGVPLAWELKVVPGVDHDASRMAQAAIDLMYPKP